MRLLHQLALLVCCLRFDLAWSSSSSSGKDWIEAAREKMQAEKVGEAAAAAAAAAQTSSLLMGGNVEFVGRVQRAADGTVSFDMNGVQVKATVTGTTGLYASMSQIHKVSGNAFQVFLDGVLQPNSMFNTSAWAAGEVVKVRPTPHRPFGVQWGRGGG